MTEIAAFNVRPRCKERSLDVLSLVIPKFPVHLGCILLSLGDGLVLETVTPVRFQAVVGSGRTKPARLECEKLDGSSVEVVAKFSAGCDRTEKGLAMEIVAACLAADLGLPVPKPYILNLQSVFVDSVALSEPRQLMADSSPIAFGSTEVGPGFRIWSTADKISDEMLPLALSIICFDAFTVNDDRRDENPNLLVRGDNMRIIDHESSFVHNMLLGWRPPWELGSLSALATPGHHIFHRGLRGRDLDYAPVEMAWLSITDTHLLEYRGSVPNRWAADTAVDDAIGLIRDVRENITASMDEVRRVLA